MAQNRRILAGGLWLFAGLPILASFVQAAVALLGTSTTGIPVIGGIKRLFQSIAVFDAAGDLLRSSPSIVLVLFVLVTVAWLAQGVGMLALTNRVFTFGAAGFVTLFLVLFELVYLPLLSADIPTVQVAGFLFVPVVVAVALWAATLVFEWDVTLDDATGDRLADAREGAQRERRAFDERIDSAVPESARHSLRPFVPDAVDTVEREADAFRDECQSVVDRAEQLTNEQDSVSSRERNERSEQVLADAQALNGQGRAEQVAEEFERSLVDAIRTEFGEFGVDSRYGRRYEFRNLREYNELPLPTLSCPPAQVGGTRHELADRLADAVETDGLPAVASAIEECQEHLSEARSVIEQREGTVADRLDATDRTLDIARGHVESLDGDARERLTEFLLEGRTPETVDSVPTVPDIRDKQERAKDRLHRGNFDEARRIADKASTAAEHIEEIAEFFADSVGATIDYGSGSIPIPPTVGPELVAQLRVPFEGTYGVEYAVDGDTLRLSSTDDAGTATTQQETRERVQQTENESVQADDVLYVLRELKSAAAATSVEGSVELQTEQLPEKFVQSDILHEIKSFAERQSDVTGVSVPDGAPPGFLSIEVSDSVSPQRAMTTLQEQYARSQN